MFFREVVMNISCVFSWDLTFPSERGRALPIFCGNLTHLTIREAFEKTGCAKFDTVGKLLTYLMVVETGVSTRVSQKNQKSEFWNATYPSGFYRLDEPPEKISAL